MEEFKPAYDQSSCELCVKVKTAVSVKLRMSKADEREIERERERGGSQQSEPKWAERTKFSGLAS